LSSTKHREALEAKYRDRIVVNPHLSRRLVSFQANKDMPLYGLFSYKEGFSADMVRMFIQDYPERTGVILDPFAGAGTTLFSAKECGFDSIGIELLPVGEFAVLARRAAERVDLDDLRRAVSQLRHSSFDALPVAGPYAFNHIPITENAFPAETERRLNAFLAYVHEHVEPGDVRTLLIFAAFSILEEISYTRKDGQFLRWDHRSGRVGVSFRKGRILAFEEALFKKLDRILTDIGSYRGGAGSGAREGASMEFRRGSCLEILPTMQDESVDLVISSPPYCNRYDYTRTYALELVFLGADNDAIMELRQSLLSCTVENREKVDYIRQIYAANGRLDAFNDAESAFRSNKALHEVLTILGKYHRQRRLNNSGIYRMVKNYFYEHSFVIFEMARLLKKGGRIYYVNDNVRYAGEVVPVDLILSEFAGAAGLTVDTIYKLPNGKGNSSQQMGKHGRCEVRKCVYCWEK
jgi:hypothetical protein